MTPKARKRRWKFESRDVGCCKVSGWLFVVGLMAWFISLAACHAGEPEQSAATNTFPSVPEVLGGKTFENTTDQDIYFLQGIHDRYASHWQELLEANITLNDFVLAPEKLSRFVNELGEAMKGRNDLAACTNLAVIVNDPSFYANSTVNHPEILKIAALALIKIGPDGRKALAGAFTVDHYRNDPSSLEALADAIGGARPAEPEFMEALAATAFDFATTNGGYYPHCISLTVNDLLLLSGGVAAVRGHLKEKDMLENPGRFEAVVDGIGEAHVGELAKELSAVLPRIEARLAELANSPGGYREDLRGLEAAIKKVAGTK